MERKPMYNINTITEEQMVDINMTAEQAQFLLEYRNRFKLLEGDETALVNLEELWEALGNPYGGYRQWKQEVAIPECELLSSEISDKRTPTRGRPKIASFVDTDTAKHLAMMSRTEAGRIVRRYFITVEKLFKEICSYHKLRISIEQQGKDVSRMGFLNGGKWAGIDNKKRFNWLVSTICGKRNLFETDLHEMEHVAEEVARLMKKGRTNEQIFELTLD